MNDDRKMRILPWGVSLLIGLPVLYVLCFGPARWIATRFVPMRGLVNAIYCPAARAYFKGPQFVGAAIIWYANLAGDVNFSGTDGGGFQLDFVRDIQDMKDSDLFESSP